MHSILYTGGFRGVLIFVIFLTIPRVTKFSTHEILQPRIFSRILRMRFTTWRIRCKQNARVKRQQQLQEWLSLAIYAPSSTPYRASGVTKFQTTKIKKINSEDPRQLFTKICSYTSYRYIMHSIFIVSVFHGVKYSLTH